MHFIRRCTGDTDGNDPHSPERMEILDSLAIPGGLEGEFVLGWRWDCEQSNQIWQSCSDVTLTK